uniref:Chitin-binding type-2 domain-containing protein n=1 Tax=Clytia hemisphaerica TaxID=252671 RepID=A0A7M5XJW7_9CNID
MKLTIVVLCLVMAGVTYAGNQANYCQPPSCYKRFPPYANQLCFNLHGHRRAVGYYRYPFSPHLFFYCNKFGVNSGTQQCPAGLWFSEKCVQCLKPYDAVNNVCSKSSGDGSGQSTNTDANCAPEGFCKQHSIKHKPLTFLFAVEGDASSFFSCNQLKEATQCLSCPAGLVFNEVCQGCRQFKTNDAKQCNAVKPDDGKPKTDEELNKFRCPDFFCQNRPVGNHETGAGEETFITCSPGNQCIKRWCPSGTVYSKACDACTYSYINFANQKLCKPTTAPSSQAAKCSK